MKYVIDIPNDMISASLELISMHELKEWIENWVNIDKYYHPDIEERNIPISELFYIFERIPTFKFK